MANGKSLIARIGGGAKLGLQRLIGIARGTARATAAKVRSAAGAGHRRLMRFAKDRRAGRNGEAVNHVVPSRQMKRLAPRVAMTRTFCGRSAAPMMFRPVAKVPGQEPVCRPCLRGFVAAIRRF